MISAQSYVFPESNGLTETDREYFNMIHSESGLTDLIFYRDPKRIGGPFSDEDGIESRPLHDPSWKIEEESSSRAKDLFMDSTGQSQPGHEGNSDPTKDLTDTSKVIPDLRTLREVRRKALDGSAQSKKTQFIRLRVNLEQENKKNISEDIFN